MAPFITFLSHCFLRQGLSVLKVPEKLSRFRRLWQLARVGKTGLFHPRTSWLYLPTRCLIALTAECMKETTGCTHPKQRLLIAASLFLAFCTAAAKCGRFPGLYRKANPEYSWILPPRRRPHPGRN